MSPVLRAALWMIGAIASFTAMAVAGRSVSLELDTFEIMLYRSVIGAVIVLGYAMISGRWREVNTTHFKGQIGRNIAHFTGQNLWFYAITMIPLAQVFALEFTSPLWVLILSPLLLGERMTGLRALAGVIGFVGILIVTRPSPETINSGVIAAALAAVAFAITTIFTKRLTRSQSITCILVYLTVTQLVFGLICAGYDGDIALPSPGNTPYIIVIGLAGLLAHLCLTTALSIAPATVVIPIDFARLPVIAIIGMLFYNEALDIWVLVGAALIFAGNYINIRSENRRNRVAVGP